MKVYGTVNILGKFWPQRTSSIAEVAWTAEDEGRILYDSDNYDLYYGSSSGWEELTGAEDLFTVGTQLIFASVLPTGWNITTVWDDKAVILTSSTSQIGTKTGDWTLSGLSTTGGHNHFTPESMGGALVNYTKAQAGTRALAGAEGHKHTLPTAGNHTHTFDGNWRPARVKLAVGIYGG